VSIIAASWGAKASHPFAFKGDWIGFQLWRVSAVLSQYSILCIFLHLNFRYINIYSRYYLFPRKDSWWMSDEDVRLI